MTDRDKQTLYGRKGKDFPWHWAQNCSQLPKAIHRYESMKGVTVSGIPRRPMSGELCNQCLAKEKKGTLVPLKRKVV